ncbi:MAG: hypothetical protein WCG80_09440, partial [Spirochaetales bacterium]
LLAPQHRRPFALNYLVFVSGISLGLSLGLEGLRWQMIPAIVLILLDLFLLFPTFATLRGRLPAKGLLPALRGFGRSFIASCLFLVAVASLALCVLFPLPRVPLTGGLAVSVRTVHFAATATQPSLEALVWYPASGNSLPLPGPETSAATWQETRERGGLPVYWQSYLQYSPARYIQGGRMAQQGIRYPAVLFTVPAGDSSVDFSWLLSDLASRGFVVISARTSGASSALPAFSWASVQAQLAEPFSSPLVWLEPEAHLESAQLPASPVSVVTLKKALLALANQPGDVLFSAIDPDRIAWMAWRGARDEPQGAELRAVVKLGEQPQGPRTSSLPELWVTGQASASDSALDKHRWVLLLDSLRRADLTDAAFWKPYLVFFGLKSQADGRAHAIVREYVAAFLQYSLWGGDASLLDAASSPVPGVRLLHQ